MIQMLIQTNAKNCCRETKNQKNVLFKSFHGGGLEQIAAPGSLFWSNLWFLIRVLKVQWPQLLRQIVSQS